MRVKTLTLFALLTAVLMGVGVACTRDAVDNTAAIIPPQPVASYAIDVAYDPDTHTLTAHEVATYTNFTELSISDIVLHQYLNAFSSEDTLWIREAGPGHRGYSFNPDSPGSMRIDGAQLADGTSLDFEAVDADATLVRADLPGAIQQGQSVVIELDYIAVLPEIFARTGFAGEGNKAFVMVGQWFPKFGVWEEGAWNAYPFHANSEFYADFGTYDVRITLPEQWKVGATGTEVASPQDNDDGTTTHIWHADNVVDFAWSASPYFKETTREVDGVTVRFLYPPDRRSEAHRITQATTDALAYYNDLFGPYGRGLYPQLTVIVVPTDAGGAGGMEYPTLFTVGALDVPGLPRCIQLLEVETVHELAHQWFQSLVATNEAEEPWLDEGFTDYSATRAMNALYDGAVLDCAGWTWSYAAMTGMEYHAMSRISVEDLEGAAGELLADFGSGGEIPMAGKAWDFGGEYALATYAKPVLALTTLQRIVGDEAMDAFLRDYVETYAFAHPGADEVQSLMAESLGADVADWFFEELVYGTGTLNAVLTENPDGSVELSRQGDLCYPVEVEIIQSRGDAPETLTWDCDTPTLEWNSMPASVIVDPENKLVVDSNLADDDLLALPDNASWLGLTSRVMHWLQWLFMGGLW